MELPEKYLLYCDGFELTGVFSCEDELALSEGEVLFLLSELVLVFLFVVELKLLLFSEVCCSDIDSTGRFLTTTFIFFLQNY